MLEAEQEKITKENQRLVDKRRDDMETAGRKVAQLNARFADWYYVIPESTYRKLRVNRDQLFKDPTAESALAPGAGLGPQGPSFDFPDVE